MTVYQTTYMGKVSPRMKPQNGPPCSCRETRWMAKEHSRTTSCCDRRDEVAQKGSS
jgi:hypothetical protein